MGAQIWKHKNKKRFRTCWRSVSKMRSPPSASTGPARKRPKIAMMASFLFPTIMVCVSTNRCCNLSSICFEGGCQERRVTVGLIVFFDALVCASLVRSWGTFSFWRAVSHIHVVGKILDLENEACSTCLLAARNKTMIESHQSIERVGIPPIVSVFLHTVEISLHAELYCSLQDST